ncbi:MAG: aldo/keto reductase [Pseudomonadales bacterium]|jgi:aryl-alcohol dehydrogenase-like predicted oxidoreductase|nr:aldo/keto reductase [Pseudomonadales bacterium]
MERASLGAIGPVSRLTLGGGGLGQLWGETSREECIATLRAAVDAGIDLIDLAPGYGRGEAEEVFGHAFAGRVPAGVRVTTKCQLGSPPAEEVEATIRRRLERSLASLRVERVDLLFLHSNIVPDDYVYPRSEDAALQDRFATRASLYREAVIPCFEALQREGRIGAWGITGTGLPDSIVEALGTEPRPAVVQAVANCLDSPGAMRRYAEPPRTRETIAAAVANGVGVMGIRAVQAGALTDGFDRPIPEDSQDWLDYLRAAPFRELASELGVTAAFLAHRYALSMDGIDTVVLGVKNRAELDECLAAEAAGPLDPELVRRIDGALARDAYVWPG